MASLIDNLYLLDLIALLIHCQHVNSKEVPLEGILKRPCTA